MTNRRHELKVGARLSLFLVSYIPLFVIMIFNQLISSSDYLVWGGFNKEALLVFLRYFGFVSLLLLLSIFGLFGLLILLRNISRRSENNGVLVRVLDIENKNSESISYLFTYIIPFVFQDLSSFSSVISVSVLLFVTYLIYSNSTMILINPTISIFYSLYSVEYQYLDEKIKTRKGMVLSSNKFLEEGDEITLKKIGYKLFFSK